MLLVLDRRNSVRNQLIGHRQQLTKRNYFILAGIGFFMVVAWVTGILVKGPLRPHSLVIIGGTESQAFPSGFSKGTSIGQLGRSCRHSHQSIRL